MFVVQDTFKTKPGKANALIEIFTAAAPRFAADGVHQHRVLVDHVADYWTVIFESTVENLDTYFAFSENEEGREAMAGYMDLVVSGSRRIYRVAYER